MFPSIRMPAVRPRRSIIVGRARTNRKAVSVGAIGLLTTGLIFGGCSSTPSKGSTSSTVSSRTATTNPVTSHLLVATFADNGGTLTVMVHDRIRVVLAGTSWTQKSSDATLLRPTSKPRVLPASSGCVTGQGCGSITVFFEALKVGIAQVLGTRKNCDGAASTCTTAPNSFTLKVVVMK